MEQEKINFWEKLYQLKDPYGHDTYYSEIRRRSDTINLINSKKIQFEKCLELGCGIGKITESLVKFCNEIIAIEISYNAIERAKKNLSNNIDNIEFVKADMYEIEFNNFEFDLIVGVESLDYTNEKEKQITKWLKWLKPGGYILFSGPNLKGYFSYDELMNLFKINELEIIEYKIVTTKFPLQWFISRIKFLQNNFFWRINIFFANLFPKLFAKHIAFLIRKK